MLGFLHKRTGRLRCRVVKMDSQTDSEQTPGLIATDRLAAAFAFAEDLHRGQVRKGHRHPLLFTPDGCGRAGARERW